MKTPLVSIITATHNSEKYIDRCLRSIADQKFTNWELIVIDDYSSDNTVKRVEEFMKGDSRIRLVKHAKNWGARNLHKIYNQALTLSKGKYVAMLEGDDWWSINKLECQLKDFKDKKVILSYGDAVLTNANGVPVKLISYSGKQNMLNNTPVPNILEKFADFNFFFVVSSLMLRRETLVNMGGFRSSSIIPFFDFPTWYELSLRGTFRHNRNILAYYRRHKHSSWVDVAKDSDAMLRSEMQRMYWEFIRKNQVFLEKKGFNINKESLITQQKKAVSKRKKNKNFSLFMNAILYEDSQALRKAARYALVDERDGRGVGLSRKMFILTILFLGPFKSSLLVGYFYIQYFFYSLRKLLS